MGVYWPLLHDLAMARIAELEEDRTFLTYHMLFIHSLPFLAVFINTLLSQVVFIPSHSLYLIGFGVFYGGLNYAGTLYRGHPLYPFLPWTDALSLLICAALLVIMFVLHQLVCLGMAICRKRPYEISRQSHY